jgi:hypothetical protein
MGATASPYLSAAQYRTSPPPKGDVIGSSIAGVLSAIFGLCCALVLLRWCRRRRFYKKVRGLPVGDAVLGGSTLSS